MLRTRLLMTLCVTALLASAFTATARAEYEEEQVGDRLHWSLGIHYATQNYFRGIAQENQNYIFHPWVGLELDFYESDTLRVFAVTEMFNSFHGGPSGQGGNLPSPWQEADWYIGAGVDLIGFRFDLGYMVAYNGNTSFRIADEIRMTLAYDDSRLFEDSEAFVGLRPHLLLAVETNAGRDGRGNGGQEGGYLEFGLEPTIAVVDMGGEPLILAFPIGVGMNLSNYYETASGTDDNKTYGFFTLGAEVRMPLAFLPKGYGKWDAFVGAHVMFLGKSVREINGPNGNNILPGNEDTTAYITFGLRMGESLLSRYR